MSLNKMFDEFNELYGLETKELTHASAMKTAQLIADELQEFIEEFYEGVEVLISCTGTPKKIDNPDKANAGKELGDIRYITGQRATEYGYKIFDIDQEVHRSNMSKAISGDIELHLEIARERYPHAHCFIAGNKHVMKCTKTGKVIKPATYSPAVITPDMWGE